MADDETLAHCLVLIYKRAALLRMTLEAGFDEGYNVPVNESTPYIFELMTTSPSKTLTVATKTPK